MSPIRYRRTSLRTALGITKEEKRINRELGITAILKPFRWWGNEKRKIKREAGYYSPEAKLARHILPRSAGKLFLLLLLVLGIPFALGWLFKPAMNPSTPANAAAASVSWQIAVVGVSLEPSIPRPIAAPQQNQILAARRGRIRLSSVDARLARNSGLPFYARATASVTLINMAEPCVCECVLPRSDWRESRSPPQKRLLRFRRKMA